MEDLRLQLKKAFTHAKVYYVESNILLVKATSQYIPIDNFKEVFKYAGALVKELPIKRFIFDKRELRVFHQPSMEWYFTEWKTKMMEEGLYIHRKVLPDDVVFRESVKIGRKNILRKYPSGKFRELDIAYAEDLERAIRN